MLEESTDVVVVDDDKEIEVVADEVDKQATDTEVEVDKQSANTEGILEDRAEVDGVDKQVEFAETEVGGSKLNDTAGDEAWRV